MFRMTVVASSTAALVGLGVASFGGLMFANGAAPFVAGSCLGYIAGAMIYYRTSLAQALLALQDHPRLMQMHLARNFPFQRFEKWQMVGKDGRSVDEEVLRRFREGWALNGLVISAWMTAAPAIEEIQTRKEAALISELSIEAAEASS